jgi:hypothetical protein
MGIRVLLGLLIDVQRWRPGQFIDRTDVVLQIA